MDKSSFADKTAGIGRLQVYLYSDGSQMPPDYTMYRRGGPKQDSCVFCGIKHAALHMVYKYKLQDTASSGESTETYCCSRCYADVRDMEAGLPGYGLRHPARDLDDVESIISEFVFSSRLPQDWVQHMSYLRVATKKFNCFFCDGGIDPMSNTEITLPVPHNNFLGGGRVKICKSCVSSYLIMTDGITTYKDECVNCGAIYPIEHLEEQYRIQERTRNQHLCPECANVLLIETGVAEAPDSLLTMTDEGYNRYRIERCRHCASDVTLDISITEPVLNERYRDATGFVCRDCQLEPDMVDQFRLLSSKPLGVQVNDEMNIYVYTLDSERYLIRRVYNNGTGRAYSPIPRDKLIETILKKDD